MGLAWGVAHHHYRLFPCRSDSLHQTVTDLLQHGFHEFHLLRFPANHLVVLHPRIHLPAVVIKQLIKVRDKTLNTLQE